MAICGWVLGCFGWVFRILDFLWNFFGGLACFWVFWGLSGAVAGVFSDSFSESFLGCFKSPYSAFSASFFRGVAEKMPENIDASNCHRWWLFVLKNNFLHGIIRVLPDFGSG